MAYNHGIGVVERETSLTTPVESTAGLQVIVGTAPIHLTKNPAAAVNKPILCYSFAECQQNFHHLLAAFTVLAVQQRLIVLIQFHIHSLLIHSSLHG